MTEWEIGARTTARMLVEARDRMYRQERDLRAAARAAGHDIDTRIQYAEGSAAAYTIACSILSGALGFPTIEELAGEWERPRDVLRPILPDADAVAFVPGDVIAAASVRMEGQTSEGDRVHSDRYRVGGRFGRHRLDSPDDRAAVSPTDRDMTHRAYGARYSGPPGDEREYWLPDDRDDLDAAWDAYYAAKRGEETAYYDADIVPSDVVF